LILAGGTIIGVGLRLLQQSSLGGACRQRAEDGGLPGDHLQQRHALLAGCRRATSQQQQQQQQQLSTAAAACLLKPGTLALAS
jgi:hypothetical protein